jgi:predicted alpha/beta superfamily hydrolase
VYRMNFFLLITLLVITASAFAQQTHKKFVLSNTEIIPIHSKITGRDHELVVVYPSSYKTYPEKKYPVLYYLDAYWDTPLLVSTYGNLIYDNQAPDFFTGYIALSPAVEWDKQALVKLDNRYAKNHKALNGRMFISYGTTEYPAFRDPIIHFQTQLTARKYKGLELLNYAMEGLDHTGIKGDGYVRGLIWVWKPKKPAGPSGLERDMTTAK